MKNILKLLTITVLLSSCANDNNFNIEGKIEGIQKGKVFLMKDNGNELFKVDSADVSNSQEFKLAARIENPEVLYIKTSVAGTPILPIFAEEGLMKITSDIKNLNAAEIEGSENQKLMEEFNSMIKNFNFKDNEIYVAALNVLRENKDADLDSINQLYYKNNKRRRLYTINFALTNSDKEIAPYIAINYLYDEHISVLDTINNSIKPELAKSSYAIDLSEMIVNTKATTLGKEFPKGLKSKNEKDEEFEINTSGKLTLINFWSKEVKAYKELMDNMEKLAEKYSGDNTQFISISIEKNVDVWKNSTELIGSELINLNDGLGNNSPIIEKLAVKGLPSNILIDQNGIIIARNSSFEEIETLIIENKN